MKKEIPTSDYIKYKLEDKLSFELYQKWLKQQNTAFRKFNPKNSPSFSIVIPVYNVKDEHLTQAIDSCLSQTYSNYEVVLVDDCSTWNNVRLLLQKYSNNKKLKIIFKKNNSGIVETTNEAINNAKNDYIVFMDCDDVIESDALETFAKIIIKNPTAGFIYSDEDRLTEDSKYRHQPFMKPDWSPDTYHSINFTNHLTCIKKSIIEKVGMLDKTYEGCQDYDISIRSIMECGDKNVFHTTKILYHWRERNESVAGRPESKPYINDAAKKLKENLIKSQHMNAHLEMLECIQQYMIIFDITNNPTLDVVIEIENIENIEQCCKQFENSYNKINIIFISNKINLEENKYSSNRKIKFLFDSKRTINELRNECINNSKSDLIMFCNEETKLLTKNALERLIAQCQQPNTGMVSPKIYRNNSKDILCSGISINETGPYYQFNFANDNNINFNCFDKIIRNAYSGTTLCAMFEINKLKKVNGFNTELTGILADIELSIKLIKNGFLTVIKNDVIVLNRGNDDYTSYSDYDIEKFKRITGNTNLIDPYVDANLNTYSYFMDLKNVSLENKYKFDLFIRKKIKRFLKNKPRLKSFIKRMMGKMYGK